MAPGSIFIILLSCQLANFCRRCLFAFFTFCFYIKNTKNIILSSLSDLTLVSDRKGIDNPLLRWLRSSYLFVQVRGTSACSPTGLIPWFSKTEGNTYATVLHHPFLFEGIQRNLEK